MPSTDKLKKSLAKVIVFTPEEAMFIVQNTSQIALRKECYV